MGAAMNDPLSLLTGWWAELLMAAYLLTGLVIGFREALGSRRELRARGVADSLAPTIILLAFCWPFLVGVRLVYWLLVFGVAADNRRLDREEADV